MAETPNLENGDAPYNVTVWRLGGKYLGYTGEISWFTSEDDAVTFAQEALKGPTGGMGAEVWKGRGRYGKYLWEFGHVPW